MVKICKAVWKLQKKLQTCNVILTVKIIKSKQKFKLLCKILTRPNETEIEFLF